MANLLIPVGTHLFSADALAKLAAEASAEHPTAKRIFKGGIDDKGVSTVLVFGSESGRLKLSTGFSHDWQGDNKFGASGSFAW